MTWPRLPFLERVKKVKEAGFSHYEFWPWRPKDIDAILKLNQELGLTRPLLQLYQVGTFPPHFQYYSRRSLGLLFRLLGLRVVEQWGDADFEPDELLDRLWAAAPLPPRLGRLAGRTAAAISSVAVTMVPSPTGWP